MADDDFDRPHYHQYHDVDDRTDREFDYIDFDWPCHDDACTDDHYVVVALDDYRKLVAAARDRHPTKHQPGGSDPARRATFPFVDLPRTT